MAKKVTEEMLGEIHITGAEQEVADQVSYRTLFIGLGGTGGHVLHQLRKKMTDEEASRAKMLYLDTDSRDVSTLRAMGVPSINISSSDTVRDIVNYLGPDDGVLNWIASDANDSAYLSSKTDEGASQYRSKSRLCLAKLLSKNGNELERVLDDISTPGTGLTKEMLRVMIVSSVAGGTGAGTFIQVALYLREYFRSHGHKDICIMGLLACPDLFVRTCDGANKENMYANAYAAVRELNAMNLVVAKDSTKDGYGKSINIAINTKSEGLLFDSKHPLFAKSGNTSYKPFDLLYFVDISNVEGGVLRTIEQYQDMMADVVYTRLYSPMEGLIRSDESNELSRHANYPTAIYGSAGYGRIRYPYHGVVTYLAVRKTHDELDYTWSQLENDWNRYKREKQLMAKSSGRIWVPTSKERAKRFLSDMDTYMDEQSTSPLRLLKGMVWDEESGIDRAEEFLLRIEEQITAATGFEANINDADRLYSLGRDEMVSEARRRLVSQYVTNKKKLEGYEKNKGLGNGKAILESLQTLAASAEAAMQSYISALEANIPGRAQFVASAVAPRTAMDADIAQMEKNPLNLFHGLLSINGTAVHPLAARYLLYRLRELMEETRNAPPKNLYLITQNLKLALDANPNDDDDVTVSDRVDELNKKFILYRESEARLEMNKYLKKYTSLVERAVKEATSNLYREICDRVLKVVDVLIEQYEGLFDNLNQYKVSLANNLKRQQDAHERSSDDRCIFINASREAKEYYYSGDLRTRDVLQQGNDQISSAAGQGIYDALIARTWKELEKQDAMLLTDGGAGYDDDEEDTYSDMGYVFENIIKLYRDYLLEKATHLDVGVVTAMIRESCRRCGLTEADLTNDIKRGRVRDAFNAIVEDVISKAQPMLNFDANNTDPYFESEQTDRAVNVATSYLHIGVSRSASKDLALIYDADNVQHAIDVFKAEHHLSRELSVNSNYSDYEMVCFRAVHCLQPTQIRKFREGYTRGYYTSYKERLRSLNNDGALSNSPHLDKSWHLREAMPYISRGMETQWYQKTAKAFIYETLSRNLCFTQDGDGVTCFNHTPEGRDRGTYIRWPARQLVTVKDISRLMEYLQEHDERVEESNALLDEMIQDLVDLFAEYTDSMPVYKAALTANSTLKKLRSNLMIRKTNFSMVTAAHGKNASFRKGISQEEQDAIRSACVEMGIEEVDINEAKESLGGLLEVAYLIHKSEEKQHRDHDFGEYIVAAALEIVEKLCAAMCGEQVTEDDDEYINYKDLYNSIIEKFVEALVVSILRKMKLLDAQSLKDAESIVYHRYLKVPVWVTEADEYKWATRLLKKK